jgi:hypothetical protein
MKTCGGVEAQLHHSWLRHYMEVSGKLHPPPPRERALGTRWVGGWVGPRAGLDAVTKKPSFCREMNPGRTAVARRYTDWVISIPAHAITFINHWYNPNSKCSLDVRAVHDTVHYQKSVTACHEMTIRSSLLHILHARMAWKLPYNWQVDLFTESRTPHCNVHLLRHLSISRF